MQTIPTKPVGVVSAAIPRVRIIIAYQLLFEFLLVCVHVGFCVCVCLFVCFCSPLLWLVVYYVKFQVLLGYTCLFGWLAGWCLAGLLIMVGRGLSYSMHHANSELLGKTALHLTFM